jgi:hypothetical protein
LRSVGQAEVLGPDLDVESILGLILDKQFEIRNVVTEGLTIGASDIQVRREAIEFILDGECLVAWTALCVWCGRVIDGRSQARCCIDLRGESRNQPFRRCLSYVIMSIPLYR